MFEYICLSILMVMIVVVVRRIVKLANLLSKDEKLVKRITYKNKLFKY